MKNERKNSKLGLSPPLGQAEASEPPEVSGPHARVLVREVRTHPPK